LTEFILPEDILDNIDKISNSDLNLLIEGESGVGKDYIAELVHKKSKRSEYPSIAINIAAIPSDLLEKELFGSIRGAFTSSESNYIGKFEKAHNSTLILDEIGDLTLMLQAKILDAIEKGIIQPIGSSETRKINCRIIAVTNKNLENKVKNGEFRKDLFYRLNVLKLTVPPLRKRVKDIIPIAKNILEDLTSSRDKYTFDKSAINLILSYDWPGNIRELKNSIERALVLSDKKEITSDFLLLSSNNNVNICKVTLKEAMNEYKNKYILQVLESNDWNVTRSAKILGIQRTYLSRLIKELYNK